LLDVENVESHVIEIAGHTRENMIVVDTSSSLQYRFGMPGPVIAEEEWQNCLKAIEESSGVDYIVCSGSMPAGVPLDFNGRLSAIAKKIGARMIVDTSGEALKHAVTEGVFMLKPNLGELSSLHGVEELHEEDIEDAAKEVIRKGGCEVMVVSMGASGAMLITKDECFENAPPTVKKKSTVGAGDSMVAGMVYAMYNKMPWQEVLQMGIATGTATTLNPGTELCRKEDVDRLFSHIKNRKKQLM
jgi:6-phosphofructokinase 2